MYAEYSLYVVLILIFTMFMRCLANPPKSPGSENIHTLHLIRDFDPASWRYFFHKSEKERSGICEEGD